MTAESNPQYDFEKVVERLDRLSIRLHDLQRELLEIYRELDALAYDGWVLLRPVPEPEGRHE
jgi:uncharacterized protein (UPF0335 family)